MAPLAAGTDDARSSPARGDNQRNLQRLSDAALHRVLEARGAALPVGPQSRALYLEMCRRCNVIVTAAEALDDALGHLSEAQLRAELTARGVQLPHGPQARGFYMELCRRHGVTRVGTAAGVAASLPRYAAAPPVDYSTFRYAAKGQSGGW